MKAKDNDGLWRTLQQIKGYLGVLYHWWW